MAATLCQTLCDKFWSKEFWLPAGYTWRDLESNTTGVYYPIVEDINWSLPAGFLMLLLRYVYESFLIVPLGRTIGIRDRVRHVTPNPFLERAYRDCKGRPTDSQFEVLAKKTELTVRQIQRWFFKRKLKDSPTPMKKFKECSWHFLFYSSAFVFGLCSFWHEKWLWDIRYCFDGWPDHHVTWQMYVLNVGEIGFYWSLLFSSFTDPKRLDFWEMTIHHIMTIALIYFSWVINFVRIGILIIVIHDVADYWVAAAKMAKYSKHQTLCEILFGGFFLTWTVSRMYVYPFRILWSILTELPKYVPAFVSLKAFLICLFALQALHIFWTYLIFKMAIQKFTKGSLEKDVRSDPESDGGLSDGDSDTNTPQLNGVKKVASRNNNVG